MFKVHLSLAKLLCNWTDNSDVLRENSVEGEGRRTKSVL